MATLIEQLRAKLASQREANAVDFADKNLGGESISEDPGTVVTFEAAQAAYELKSSEYPPELTADVVGRLMSEGEPTDDELEAIEAIESVRQAEFESMADAEEANPYANIMLGGTAIAVMPDDQSVLKGMHESFTSSITESKPHWVSSFMFPRKSLDNLMGVYPPLVFLCSQALQLSRVDFKCVTGMLTEEEQLRLVERGLSRTMYSPHLRGENGYAMAVELVPYVDGRLSYKRELIYLIVAAMYDASVRSICPDRIRWHGALDMRLDDLGDSPEEFNETFKEVAAGLSYGELLNGTRFEWVL